MKTLILILTLITCISQTTVGNNVVEKESQTSLLENEFIKIIVTSSNADLGKFAIETTEGSPDSENDNNQPLIYGRPIPWTSYTTLFIDNTPFIFGHKSKKIERRINKDVLFTSIESQITTQNSIISKASVKNITITQTLSFLRNPQTQVEDSALIEYEITNLSEQPHEVGLRMMLDTKLGSNDGAPFRIGSNSITSEVLFNKNDLENYWLTFDSLSSPNVIAQGILKNEEFEILPPDTLILANWGSLVDNPWNFPYEKDRPFIRKGELEKDTALALYWNPQMIEPNQTLTFKTAYGLGGITLSPGELSLGITAPAKLYINSKQEILIMGYILNSGGFNSRETVVTFNLPEEFEIIKGETTTTLAQLDAGETFQIPLLVKIRPEAKAGKKRIQMDVSSSTIKSNNIEREITLIAPPKITAKLSIFPPLNSHSLFLDAILTISNPSDYTISNINAELSLPKDLTLLSLDINKKTIKALPPKTSKDIHWKINCNKNTNSTNIGAKISSSTGTVVLKENIPPYRKSPAISTKLNKNEIKKDSPVYLDIRMDTQEIGEPITISFDPMFLSIIRYSVSEESKKIFEITTKENSIQISQKSKKIDAYKNIKIHFLGKQEGNTELITTITNKEKEITKLTIRGDDYE
jgi:hypothetical protein